MKLIEELEFRLSRPRPPAYMLNADEQRAVLKALKALVEIAAFTDEGASARLAMSGSYALFDEPGSVSIAREALSAFPQADRSEG